MHNAPTHAHTLGRRREAKPSGECEDQPRPRDFSVWAYLRASTALKLGPLSDA